MMAEALPGASARLSTIALPRKIFMRGIPAKTTSGGIRVMINRTDISNNGGIGIRGDGASAAIFIGSSIVTGNSTGVSVLDSASVQSYQNNQINGNNVTDGTPLPAIMLH